MNEKQQQHIDSVPVMYRPLVTRALSADCPPRAAIKARCLQCVGFTRADITSCTATDCALRGFRPYQKGSQSGEGEDLEV